VKKLFAVLNVLREGRRLNAVLLSCTCWNVLCGTRIAALWRGCPGWGRERHSEHSGRAFTGVDAACQRPGAKRSRKAFRALCGTGLDGPGSTPVPFSRFAIARLLSRRSLLLTRFRFVCVRVSRTACGLASRFSQSPKPPFVLVVFHREPCPEFVARIALRVSAHYRIDAGQSLDAHRMPHAWQ